MANTSQADASIRMRVEENVKSVRDQISAACECSNRDLNSVKLVAVTKYAHEKWLSPLPALGIVDFGESRPQQLTERVPRFSGITWHMIGHLQRNKVKSVVPNASLIHSVDSFRLAERINQFSQELNQVQAILMEVNITGEESKSGFSVDEFRRTWEELSGLENVKIEGLMTMAPKNSNEAELRSCFSGLRNLRDEVSDEHHPLRELSMGMSGDFPIAIEEGATLVRVGSRLFTGLENDAK